MKYTYTCKKVPLNDSIKEYAEKRLEKLEKYFHREDATAFVTFTVEKDKLKQFLSSSERKMADLNRNISGKQGGRRRR